MKTKYSMVCNNTKRLFIDNIKKLFLIQPTRWKKDDKKE